MSQGAQRILIRGYLRAYKTT
nr:hypothetical protein [Rickettsia endosymbiont of Ceutorhynchus assimilis]